MGPIPPHDAEEVQNRQLVMQVDQPLCYDCLHRVQDEVELSIRQAQQDCKAYEAALTRLNQDGAQPYTDEVCCACTDQAAFTVLCACMASTLAWS